MSDYAQYHALGHGENDPNDPNRTTAPAPQQFQHPIAPSPYQQQQQQQQQQQYQQGSPYQQQGGYGGAPQYAGGFQAPPGAAQQGSGGPDYGYQQGNPASPSQDSTLASQMSGMSFEGQTGTVRKKKKDRHAHHTVEPTGSSQAFNGMPGPGVPSSQFLSQPGTPGLASPGFGGQYGGGQYSGAPGTPQMTDSTQFGGQPTSQFASQGGMMSPGLDAGGGSSDVAANISPAGPAKVSAEDMPSVALARDVAQQQYLTNVYPTFERHVPPPAVVSFLAHDQGNSSPKYTRLTMNNIPSTAEGLQATGLPLGLILQPLAPLAPGEPEIPILDFGDGGPPRCRRCRAYINPFMMFRNGGNKFVCNLCSYPNETAPEYFCATSPQGVRVDRDQRPELHRGTVEFVVPKEYWTREPVGMRLLFLIDATQESYNKGFMETFCDGILSALYGGDGEEEGEKEGRKRRIPEGAKVGFVTYDKDIHFYNLHVSFSMKYFEYEVELT